jgi:hypothetical protein
MYTTKGGSQFVEEIYTHYEAQMQLIFSKKTQKIALVVIQATKLYLSNKNPPD